MFNFVIVTNKVTPEVTKTLEILQRTKTVNDRVIVVNYNNYHIKYRSMEDIEYHHIKQSVKVSINSVLPRDSNVVLLGSTFTITEKFVESLYKHYDFKSLCALRVDNITPDRKFVESDYRIGSNITTSSFKHMAMAFNTAGVLKVGDTPEETAIYAQESGMSLKLLPNVRVLLTNTKKKSKGSIGITIFVPSLKYKYIDTLKEMARPNDRIYEFECDNRGLSRFINQKTLESHNECILIINPDSNINDVNMLGRIRSVFDNKGCLLFDTSDELSSDAWLVFPKNRYVFSHKVIMEVMKQQSTILSYNSSNVTRYTKPTPKKRVSNISTDNTPLNMISIIIPFMYNGDRWSLFEASVERLHIHTRDYDNIEIIVHETSPKRHITPSFIEKYDIVHLYSEYNGVFHRAWNLNIAAKHLAKGEVLVFFDADLIIDDKWVNELLNCDKTIPYIGWGKMNNLNKAGTDKYLKTKQVNNLLERVREPNVHAAAAGINVIPRDMFFGFGGWSEKYVGYGGEDNSLSFKMLALGLYDKNMKSWT